jgi:hypothetical protein
MQVQVQSAHASHLTDTTDMGQQPSLEIKQLPGRELNQLMPEENQP